MTPSRLLIINADDLGISHEVNRGIFTAHERGVVTDSSLLVRRPYSKEAIRTIRATPCFRVGVHIDLDPLLGWKSPGRERFPHRDLLRMMDDPNFGKRVRNEIDGQISAFLKTGVTPSHIDTHHHAHGFPQIFIALLEAMERYGIKALRFCRNGYHLMGREDISLTTETARWMEEELGERGIFYPHHFIDPALPFSLNGLPQGVTELMVHPSIGGEPWRSKDFDMLMDPRFMAAVGEEDIELISFPEAAASLSFSSLT